MLAVVEREPVASDRGREAPEHGPPLEEHGVGPAVCGARARPPSPPGRRRPRRYAAGSRSRPGQATSCDKSLLPGRQGDPSPRHGQRLALDAGRAGAGRSRPWRRHRPGCGRRAARSNCSPSANHSSARRHSRATSRAISAGGPVSSGSQPTDSASLARQVDAPDGAVLDYVAEDVGELEGDAERIGEGNSPLQCRASRTRRARAVPPSPRPCGSSRRGRRSCRSSSRRRPSRSRR